FKVILGVLFGLLVASIVGWGIVSYQNNNMSIKTANQIRHTHEVLEVSDELSSLYKDLQLESITFFISTDSTLLHPYLESKAKLVPLIADLRVLTKDNASQQVRIDSLLYNVKQLMAFTDKGLLKNGTDYATEVLSRRVKNGFMYRQNIRKII